MNPHGFDENLFRGIPAGSSRGPGSFFTSLIVHTALVALALLATPQLIVTNKPFHVSATLIAPPEEKPAPKRVTPPPVLQAEAPPPRALRELPRPGYTGAERGDPAACADRPVRGQHAAARRSQTAGRAGAASRFRHSARSGAGYSSGCAGRFGRLRRACIGAATGSHGPRDSNRRIRRNGGDGSAIGAHLHRQGDPGRV